MANRLLAEMFFILVATTLAAIGLAVAYSRGQENSR
jgi:hypothetical protein